MSIPALVSTAFDLPNVFALENEESTTAPQEGT